MPVCIYPRQCYDYISVKNVVTYKVAEAAVNLFTFVRLLSPHLSIFLEVAI